MLNHFNINVTFVGGKGTNRLLELKETIGRDILYQAL